MAKSTCNVSADWLRHEYFDNGKSLRSIGKELGRNAQTIYNWFKAFGIQTRPQTRAKSKTKFETLDKGWLISQYVDNKIPSTQIAASLGVDATTVRTWLVRLGVTIRNEKEYRIGYKTPESTKKKIAAALIGKPLSPETRKKLLLIAKERSGPNSRLWRGGKSFAPYCPKFTRQLKEHVRESFGRRCVLCSLTEEQNGKKLDVHHVDYNKGQGCGLKWSLVPLCESCHRRTGAHRHYYFNLLSNYWLMNSDINFNAWCLHDAIQHRRYTTKGQNLAPGK